MASLFAYVLALCLGGALASDPTEDKFREFEQMFEKTYESAEERARRLQIFADNLELIAELQLSDPGAQYSHLTPMADLSPKEFASLNTLKENHLLGEITPAPKLDASALPTSFDWVAQGAVNPVKNQGGCGSCWAFSTVANIEGANFVKTKTLISLSEQELVDCVKTDEGCGGGLPSDAFKWMLQHNLGMELEGDYPYEGHNGQCGAVQSKERTFIGNWTQISTDEDQIAAALIKYGPLSIGINAMPMQFYFGGISKPWRILCNPKSLDHGVAIVGFGEDKGTKYWKIRNSWGARWGEEGYYRIIRGTGACGLNTMVTTAILPDASGEDIIV